MSEAIKIDYVIEFAENYIAMDELYFTNVCRAQNVIRPYLEVLE